MIPKKQKKIKPPNLLRGLFFIILFITSLILVSSWSIINYDVEKLVAARTSEYAHSIALIAANSSADALLSDDKLQLNMLVENVAKDPYIKSATIFAEDGQIIAQYPIESNNAALAADIESDTQSSTSTTDTVVDTKTLDYLEAKSNLPYVEPIIYQGVTAGWFKVLINRSKLESSFRQSVSHSKNIIILIAILLLAILITVITKYEQNIKTLVSLNHRLIQVNSPDLPFSKLEWMDKVRVLSETQFYKLSENKQLPTNEAPWITSKRSNDTLFVYCQFAMQDQDDEETANCLTQAEGYLQSAIQAHGLHSQGDILSGYLIPLFTNSNRNEAISEVIALTHLIKVLLESLPLQIKMKAFISSGSILVLENNRAEVSGISLSNRLSDKISKLSSFTSFGEIICINFELDELETIGQFKPLENETNILSFQLVKVIESIQQQVNRQESYIKNN